MIVTLRDIEAAVCARFGLTPAEMKSKRPYLRLVRPRQVAMYLARDLTNQSYPQIGAYFGGRHHTTAMAARRRITALQADPDFQVAVEGCREILARKGPWKAVVRQELENDLARSEKTA